jgi:predicted nucleic acid-binding protein
MNVVDSSGWIEYFINSATASSFAAPIRDTESLIVPTICLYEVFKRVLLVLGDDKALKTIGQMSLGIVVDLNRDIAMRAAQISLDMKLAMTDSIILATARAYNATLWTQDEHFKDLESVRYIEKK